MHTIYIGQSLDFSEKEMRECFDIDTNHSKRISKFEQWFGGEYISAGSFEVYGRNDFADYNFDKELISRLLPFSPKSEWLEKLDFINSRCVFYVATEFIDKMSVVTKSVLREVSLAAMIFEWRPHCTPTVTSVHESISILAKRGGQAPP